MKTGLVTAVKNEVAKSISPKKAEKAASVAVKDGKEMIAAGQDALAAQGKSMVKPYEKPEMTVVEIKRQDNGEYELFKTKFRILGTLVRNAGCVGLGRRLVILTHNIKKTDGKSHPFFLCCFI